MAITLPVQTSGHLLDRPSSATICFSNITSSNWFLEHDV